MKRPGLTGFQLKMIAIIAMVIDHVGYGFVDFYTPQGQIMRIIGRLTAPIMCFFIAQGYLNTRSVTNYIKRLAIFALISHVPYVLYFMGEVTLFPTSVIYTLMLGLIAIYVYDQVPSGRKRNLMMTGIFLFSTLGDWLFLAVVFCLIFYIERDDFAELAKSFTIIILLMVGSMIIAELAMGSSLTTALHNHLFQLGTLLALPLLALYNGERGGNKYTGWIFYIFYPAHLLMLYFISLWLYK